MKMISRFFNATLTVLFVHACFSANVHADTLRDIYELAVKNDAKLKAAEATYKANIETEQQTKSRLLPQLNGDASYGRNEREQNSQSITGTDITTLGVGNLN